MTNIEKLMNIIPDENTCALVTFPVNRRYFTGFKSSDGIVVCFKEKAFFLVDFRYFEKASAVVTDCEVIEEKDNTVQLTELFTKFKTARVMIDAEHMTVSELSSFKKSFPRISVDSSSFLSGKLNEMRMFKTDDEIKKMQEAQNIADETYSYILENVSIGMTERDLALMTDNHMKKLGAEDISFDTIALTGKNTSLPHGVPGYDRIMKNSFVLMDFGAVVDGMHSDMTRTFYMGTPSEEEKDAYYTVLKAQTEALNSVRTEMKCSDLDHIARKIIDMGGYPGAFGHSLGHGVGYEIHEAPRVSKKSDVILKPGMVITVEPGIYLPGKFGIRIEDTIVLEDDTDRRYKNFVNSDKSLITLG